MSTLVHMKQTSQGQEARKESDGSYDEKVNDLVRVARYSRRRKVVSGSMALGAASLILVATAVPVAAILSASTTTVPASHIDVPVTSTTVAPVRATSVSTVAVHSIARHNAATLLSRERADARVTSTTAPAVARLTPHVVAHSPAVTPTTEAKAVAKSVAKTPAVVRHTPVATTSVPPKHVAAVKSSRPAPAVPVKGGPSAAARALMSSLNPSSNIEPSPNFLSSGTCTKASGTWVCDNPCITSSLTWPTFTNAPACTNYVLAAINNARTVEGFGPMALPSNWYSLTTGQQLFVVTNLERTARGLPPYLGINSALSAETQHAAVGNNDPGVAAGFAIGNDAQGTPGMGAAWSGGFSVLAADYIWMYDDAWAGSRSLTSNVACTSPSAAGCWGHRDELLGYDPGYNPGVGLDATTVEVGVGFAVVGSSSSFAVLVELPKAAPPTMTFTWANNVVPYL